LHRGASASAAAASHHQEDAQQQRADFFAVHGRHLADTRRRMGAAADATGDLSAGGRE
jgi:hypothetical protein